MAADEGTKSEDGLRGPDKQQARLRDVHGGTYETPQPTSAPDASSSKRTEHQREQPGADVRQGVPDSDMTPEQQSGLPEGLVRPRLGPYDRNVGRHTEATQVPGPKAAPRKG